LLDRPAAPVHRSQREPIVTKYALKAPRGDCVRLTTQSRGHAASLDEDQTEIALDRERAIGKSRALAAMGCYCGLRSSLERPEGE
jgi:hypothetical protein